MLKKMGPMKGVMKLVPGMGRQLDGLDIDERQMARVEAIVLSMTPHERRIAARDQRPAASADRRGERHDDRGRQPPAPGAQADGEGDEVDGEGQAADAAARARRARPGPPKRAAPLSRGPGLANSGTIRRRTNDEREPREWQFA